MPVKFLQLIAGELLKFGNIHQKIVILPNKRSGLFLKKALVESLQKPVLSPQILTIEDFLSGLTPFIQADWLELIFEFFQAYKELYGDKNQSFEEFIRWAPTLLNDFNQIDAFNVDAREVFTYINEVKKIEDWQLKPENPKIVTDYLKFYASLYDLYQKFKERLINKNLAYSGMISRYVFNNIEKLSENFESNQIIFAGFNALNTCQTGIIKQLINNGKAKIFWDADQYYLQPHFEAGRFINGHIKNFKDFNWIFDHFKQPKQIEIIGVTGSTTQAQAVADILKRQPENGEILNETAIVLNEEHLLLPLIDSLPDNVEAVNITLGLPLKNLPVSRFFELLVQLYAEKEQYGHFNLETITGIVNQNQFEQILPTGEQRANQSLLEELKKFKTNLISQELWLNVLKKSKSFINELIISDFSVLKFTEKSLNIIDYFASQNPGELDGLALVKFEKIFKQLQDFIIQTGEIGDMRTFQYLFKRLLYQERLAFEGEPLVGLQIMGFLETRLLDFDHIILTSMNEGVIPYGRKDRSIIPFEIRKHFGLPLHYDHNAIAAYHFYRLLQRAKKISLIYNIAGDGFGTAEQSRFITQLENELDTGIHQIKHRIFDLSTDTKVIEKEQITKTTFALQKLRELALSGFSPSALGTYVRNPLAYYKTYILELQEPEEISDAIPLFTMGNIVHEVIEILYKPYTGKTFRVTDFDNFLKQYEDLALKLFIKKSFGEETPVDAGLITGKNLIVFEIIKKNIKDLLHHDLATVKAGNRLEIVGLEQKLKARLPVKDKEVFIKGKFDRIDRLNSVLRIIDYKTGSVKSKNISIGRSNKNQTSIDLNPLRTNEQKEKLLQLLTYAWLYYQQGNLLASDIPFEVGILSTRNIRKGLLKAKIYGNTKINTVVLKEFEKQLILLVEELFNPDVPFVESDSKY